MLIFYAKPLTDTLGKSSKLLAFLSKLSLHSIRPAKQQIIQTIASTGNEIETRKNKKSTRESGIGFFGCSLILSRTLRRHLKSEETSYQQILDHVRFHLARHYLASTQMSVEEISERIGFSDSANFRCAFRKWSGDSPRQYRRQAPQL